MNEESKLVVKIPKVMSIQILNIVADKDFFYDSVTEFVEYALRDNIHKLRPLLQQKRRLEIMEGGAMKP